MSTVGDVVAYNISLDANNITGNPETIYNNNTTVFAASSNVPVWLYTPLWVILGCASSDLSSRVIADLGESRIPTSPCVVIQPTELEEAADKGYGNKAQIAGARTCKVDIMVKNVSSNKDISLVSNALNRITYLIDSYSRENRTTNVDFADLTIPNTIQGFYQNPFRCHFVCTYLPVAKEGYSTFTVEYYLTFV